MYTGIFARFRTWIAMMILTRIPAEYSLQILLEIFPNIPLENHFRISHRELCSMNYVRNLLKYFCTRDSLVLLTKSSQMIHSEIFSSILVRVPLVGSTEIFTGILHVTGVLLEKDI